MTYAERQSRRLAELGTSDTGSSLLDMWSAFIGECREGYRWDYSEYLNELAVRDSLGVLERDPALEAYPEHATFLENLQRLDARFREVLNPNREVGSSSEPWWRRGVLKRSSQEYAEYVRSVYAIDVEAMD